jgi:hypothetical protein
MNLEKKSKGENLQDQIELHFASTILQIDHICLAWMLLEELRRVWVGDCT